MALRSAQVFGHGVHHRLTPEGIAASWDQLVGPCACLGHLCPRYAWRTAMAVQNHTTVQMFGALKPRAIFAGMPWRLLSWPSCGLRWLPLCALAGCLRLSGEDQLAAGANISRPQRIPTVERAVRSLGSLAQGLPHIPFSQPTLRGGRRSGLTAAIARRPSCQCPANTAKPRRPES